MKIKFGVRKPVNQINESVCKYNAVKIMCKEVKSIIEDKTIKGTCYSLLTSELDFSELQMMQIYKSKFILEWIDSSLSKVDMRICYEHDKLRKRVFSLLNANVENYPSNDEFVGEINILTKLRSKDCDVNIIIKEHQFFDNWRVHAEVLKF